MLAAILHGKAAKVSFDGHDVSWRELFRQREDLLTAGFFGRFSYLSSQKRIEALALLIGDNNAEKLGDIQKIHFWPSLKMNSGSEHGMRRVEPDVIIQCDGGLVMVEVKPPWERQYLEQWHNELRALLDTVKFNADSEFETHENVHFVALGNSAHLDIQRAFENFETESYFDFMAHQKEWNSIISAISSLPKSGEKNDLAILEDWLSLFALFGINRPIKPLSSLIKLTTIYSGALSIVVKMHPKGQFQKEPGAPQLPWQVLCQLTDKYFMEDIQCKSLLKKLALS